MVLLMQQIHKWSRLAAKYRFHMHIVNVGAFRGLNRAEYHIRCFNDHLQKLRKGSGQ